MPDNDARKGKPTLLTVRGLSEALLEDLESLFPERCPDLEDAERHIWHYAGKRALVCALRQALQYQQSRGEPVLRPPLEFQ